MLMAALLLIAAWLWLKDLVKRVISPDCDENGNDSSNAEAFSVQGSLAGSANGRNGRVDLLHFRQWSVGNASDVLVGEEPRRFAGKRLELKTLTVDRRRRTFNAFQQVSTDFNLLLRRQVKFSY